MALVTVNSLLAPLAALEFVPPLAALEFIPEFSELAPAEAPDVEPVAAFAFEPVLPDPSWPVTCTSFPIRVRTAFKLPVNLYALPDLSVKV